MSARAIDDSATSPAKSAMRMKYRTIGNSSGDVDTTTLVYLEIRLYELRSGMRVTGNLLQSRSAYRFPPLAAALMNAGKALRRLLLGSLTLLVLLLLTLIVAAVLGISISAAPWRHSIATKTSALIGRPVTLDGPLRLTIGLRPELTVGGIAVANPPGFSSPQLATLGRAHMLVELWPLLRDEISVLAVDAQDVPGR